VVSVDAIISVFAGWFMAMIGAGILFGEQGVGVVMLGFGLGLAINGFLRN
jgi:hypothetical protein